MNRKLVKLGAAVSLVALSAWSALALSVDQTRNMVARQFTTQQTSYYRITVNFNDTNIATGQKFAQVPKDTFITKIACHTGTAFNATSTNKLRLGTSAVGAVASTVNWGIMSGSQFSGTDMLIQNGGYQEVSPTGSNALGRQVTSDADHDLWAAYTQTGTAATAGLTTCVIEFIPNNDN